MRTYRWIAAVCVGLIGFAVAGGQAFGFWSQGGSGSGGAVSSTMLPATIDAVAIGGALRPNGPARSVGVVMTNPNPFPVSIAQVGVYAITSDRPGCTGAATGVSVDVGNLSGVLPGASTTTLYASASMSTASIGACQGATFTAYLTLEVHT